MSKLTPEERDRSSRELYEAARAIKGDGPEQRQEQLHLLDNALAARPAFVNALVLRASIHQSANAPAAAIADLTVAIQLESNTAERRRLASLHGTRAACYAASRRWQEAQMDLAQAAELEPDNGTWRLEAALVCLAQGATLPAQLHLQSALNPRAAGRMTPAATQRALQELGLCQLKAGAASQALATLRKAREHEETAVVANGIGLALHATGDVAGARDAFQSAVAIDPHVVRHHTNLAVATHQLGRREEALRLIATASTYVQQQRHSDPAPAYQAALDHEERLLGLYSGCIRMELGQRKEAQRDLAVAQRMPAAGRRHRAAAAAAAASTSAGAAAAAAPGDIVANALYAQGLALMAGGHDEAAEEVLRERLLMEPEDRAPHVPSLVQLGMLLHRRGSLHAALAEYERALLALRARGQDDVRLLMCCGLAYQALRTPLLAVRYFTRCCALEPTNGRYHLYLASAQATSGNVHGALRTLAHAREALELLAEEAGGLAAHAAHMQSVLLLRAGQPREAVEWAERAAALPEGGRGLVLLQLARAHLALEEVDAAAEAATRAADLFRSPPPLSSPSADTAAAAEGGPGSEAAKEEVEEGGAAPSAAAAAPPPPETAGIAEALYMRARAHHRAGRLAEALADLHEAAEVQPSLRLSSAYCYSEGALLAAERRLPEAAAALDAAIARDRSGAPPLDCHYQRALVRLQLGDAEGAAADATVVLRLEPRHLSALVCRCVALKRQGLFSECAADWLAATRADDGGQLRGVHLRELEGLPAAISSALEVAARR